MEQTKPNPFVPIETATNSGLVFIKQGENITVLSPNEARRLSRVVLNLAKKAEKETKLKSVRLQRFNSTKRRKNMKKTQLQQGDVWIESATIPPGATTVATKTLAEGEVTGHAHRIVEGDVEILAYEGLRYLRVLSDKAVLAHEEHLDIVIPRGDYAFGQVIEYDYETEEARYVQD